MSDERLHLPTLQKVKSMFENQTDMSCATSAYQSICEMISQEEILLTKEDKSNETCPAWLTQEIRNIARNTWNSHLDHNDNKRTLAIKQLRDFALQSEYSIDLRISQALYLLKTFCL
jgi:hypothetical protein